MAKKDDWQAAFLGAEDIATQTKAGLVCRADDLKGVLQALAEQIADADRRHSQTLQAMHQRLARLGGQTESVKANLPPHLAAAFDRIEDGMSQLAERLAETERPRQPADETAWQGTAEAVAATTAPTPPAVPAAAATFSLAHMMANTGPVVAAEGMPAIEPVAPHHAVLAEGAAITMPTPAPMLPEPEAPAILAARALAQAAIAEAATAPPPLRSAIGLQPPGTWGHKEPAKVAEPVYVQNPDDPWDQHSAAALTRLYESGEAGLPPLNLTFEPQPPVGVSFAAAQAVPPATALAAPSRPTAASPQPLAASGLFATSHDTPSLGDEAQQRAWLDSRLTDIATRVERSLLDLKPDATLVMLGERFDHFEQRFTSALDGVATRSDVEGLRIVEAHIAELSEQIEQTRRQLTRLDSIEHQLGQLSSAFSDEEMVRLLGGIVPTEDDLVRFAEEAASRVASRIISAQPASGQSGAVMAMADPAAAQRATDAAQAAQAAQMATSRQMQNVQDLLADFMDERRRGEANTADALETIQHAMQHMLDRVDAIEAQRSQASAAPQPAMIPMRHETQPVVQTAPSADPRAAVAPSRTFAEEAKAAARLAAQAPIVTRAAGHSGAEGRIEPKLDIPIRPPAPRTDVGDDATTTHIPTPDARQATAAAAAMAQTEVATAIAARAAAATKPADRQAFIAMARKAAEQAKGDVDKAAPTAAKGQPAGAPGSVGASLKERLAGSNKEPGGKGSGGKGLLLVACLAGVLLAGYLVVTRPGFRLLQSGSTIQQGTPPAATPKAATIQPAAKQSPTAGPAIDAEATPAAPETVPEEPAEKPKRRHSVPETGVDDLGALTLPKPNDRAAAAPNAKPQPAVEHIGMGIAIEQGPHPMSAEALMRSRQQAHIASLSQRTAHDAARTAAVPTARIPAGIVEAPGQPRNAEPTTIELPPAAVGPLSLRLAAAKGDASAQFDVAARFAEGRGVKQDFPQAAGWYQRAATQGHAQSQYRLAALYERGLGVQSDPARARIWYKRAAEQGNVKAMHNLAVMSAGRDGVQPDYAAALQWFTEAAERGLSDSQFNLGVLSESGLGLERDLVGAYKWFSLAARGGDKEALRRREQLKTRLEAQEIAAGDAAVAQWRSRPVERLANDPHAAGDAWKRQAGAQ